MDHGDGWDTEDGNVDEEEDDDDDDNNNIDNNEERCEGAEVCDEGAREWRDEIAEEMWDAYLYHMAARDMEGDHK